MKVAFVYPNSRRQLAADVAARRGADSFLLGQNHLHEFGHETFIHEPRLLASGGQMGLWQRFRWSAREVTLPWELGDADIVVGAIVNVLPLAARVRRRPQAVVFDFQLATLFDRSSPARRRVLAASLRSAAAVISLSMDQRVRLLERVRLDPQRVHVCHLGVDHKFFVPPVPDRRDGSVLVVGKDLARDYETLAAAVDGLDARVVLVTEERNLRGIRLPGNVEVMRNLEYTALRDLYAGAGCVALPVRRPGFSLGTESSGFTALLEAMAMAKPIVVSDRPVFREYVELNRSALVVAAEDPGALRLALQRLLSDAGLARTLGARGREIVEMRFTMQHFAAGVARVLEGLGGRVAVETGRGRLGVDAIPPSR